MLCQGIEGTYITFHSEYSPEDDDPLQGIRFAISPSLGNVSSCLTCLSRAHLIVR